MNEFGSTRRPTDARVNGPTRRMGIQALLGGATATVLASSGPGVAPAAAAGEGVGTTDADAMVAPLLDSDTATRTKLDERYVSETVNNASLSGKVEKGELVVSVRDKGAVGDGITNDTPAVQAAINDVKAAGGGTVFFPAGTYYMREAAYLCSDLTITGRGATLVKKFNSDPQYTFFIGSSGTSKGYGAGANNVTCHGMNFSGSFAASPNCRSACAFALHHCDNFLAYNNTFTEMSGTGHRFDLQGCRYVTIRDSVFKGFNTEHGLLYTEDIQLDFSTTLGGSFVEASTDCYDGLPTIHVTVDNNKWLPLTIGDKTYPAANPVGSHSSVLDQYHRFITITNNYVGPTLVEDTVTTIPSGCFHFVAVKDLRFTGNIVENDGRTVDGLRLWRAISGLTVGTPGGPNDVTNRNAKSVKYVGSMVSSNIKITGNTFRGFSSSSTAKTVIYIQGSETPSNRAQNILIADNTFEDNKYRNDNTVNNGPNLIQVSDTDTLIIRGNRAFMARRLAYILRSRNVIVSQNNTRKTAGNTLAADACENVTISGNALAECGLGFDIYLSGGTVKANISNNIIETSHATGPTIRVTGITGLTQTRVTVCGNSLISTAATSKAIEVVGRATQNIISNNLILGYKTPITYGAGSVAIEANNTTT